MRITDVHSDRARKLVRVDVGYREEFAIVRCNETDVEGAIIEHVGRNYELLGFDVCLRLCSSKEPSSFRQSFLNYGGSAYYQRAG